MLLPIHDMPEEQGHENAVGNFSAYEDIHNPSGQKRKLKPFKMVTQDELRLNPKNEKETHNWRRISSKSKFSL